MQQQSFQATFYSPNPLRSSLLLSNHTVNMFAAHANVKAPRVARTPSALVPRTQLRPVVKVRSTA